MTGRGAFLYCALPEKESRPEQTTTPDLGPIGEGWTAKDRGKAERSTRSAFGIETRAAPVGRGGEEQTELDRGAHRRR